jgi:aerobic carbon-monoxide dehydrogenase medium subunit
MTLADVDYVRARDVDDAIRLLRAHEGAKLLAGGHSLIPMMKLRLTAPALLVDLADVPGLRGTREECDGVHVGALTTHAALAADPLLRRAAPALADAASELGDPQVRNRGTVGGACAHGDPSADYPAVMLALRAAFHLSGPDGTRIVLADEFFQGMFETAVTSVDVLRELSFEHAPHSAYVKFHHPASGYAVVGVAAALQVAGGTIVSARVAVGGVGDTHFRAPGVERALVGVATGDARAIAAACANAAAGIEPRGDRYASAAYRAAMADVFAERAITRALAASASRAPA